MANEPLESIKFPGIADKFTVPAVDNTLTVQGAVADAKAVGDALNNLNVDATLTRQGKPADAKKVGDEISGLKADLSDVESALDEVAYTEITSENLFNVNDSGMYLSGKGLARSGDLIDNENGAVIKISVYNTVDFCTLMTLNSTGTAYVQRLARIAMYDGDGNNLGILSNNESSYAAPTLSTCKYLYFAVNTQLYPLDTVMIFKNWDDGSYPSFVPYAQETYLDSDKLDGTIVGDVDNLKTKVGSLEGSLENEYGRIAVLESIEPPNKSGSNRVFFYLYQNPGTYIATDTFDMWVSVQGWDTPAFNGNNLYNTGKIYDLPYVFTIDPQNTGLYYRVVFGVDSGSITDDMRLNSTVSKLTRYDDTIEVEVKSKNNSNVINNVLAIAHGGTTDFPANNLKMYKEMYKKGIKYWECDIRKCLDGFVLCHDDDIYNHAITASGEIIAQGTVSIANSTVAQLQQYKFSVITNKQSDGAVPGYENTTIPTLQEFIYLAKALGAIPVFEIKFNATLEDVTDICNIVKSHGMFNQSYFLTYGWAQRIAGYLCENGVKRLVISVSGADQQTAIDTAYGYISNYADQFDDLVYDIDDGNYTILTPQLCAYAASKGFRIIVYGIYNTTTLAQIIGAYEKGCSGYMTNLFNPVPIIQNYYLGT